MTTLLLVDDNQTLVDLYAKGLTQQGFEVITAYSGQKCLEILTTIHPDIILLDVMMPDMDGWETVQNIRELPESHEIPVLIVTAKPLLAEELLVHGDLIDGFLLKPFRIADLANRIRDFERERSELAACMQKMRETGADPTKFEECAELARQVTVRNRLIDQIITEYEVAFADPDQKEQIPEVVSLLQDTCHDKVNRLTELAGQDIYNCITAIPSGQNSGQS